MQNSQKNQRAQQNWAKVRNIFKQKNKMQKKMQKENQSKSKNIEKTAKYTLKNQKYKLFEKEFNQTQEQFQTVYFLPDNKKILTYTPVPKINKIISQSQAIVDTTGYWVWQAQQILAYYLFVNAQSQSLRFYKTRRFLQLGAGTSGLAGLIFSLQNSQCKVIITDGKQQNIPFLKKNIQQNKLQTSAKGQFLLWGRNSCSDFLQIQSENSQQKQPKSQHKLKFDLIVAADCLFFQKYHTQLIQTLETFMHQQSTSIFVNPKRGKSMSNFLTLLKLTDKFTYQFNNFQNNEFYKKQLQKVSSLADYKEDSDKFFFIIIKMKIEN